ncbi:unnamed protein product [Closterium sp. NIES-64]|nr:unnamed protein product [Closterium sp. NIES-64]
MSCRNASPFPPSSSPLPPSPPPLPSSHSLPPPPCFCNIPRSFPPPLERVTLLAPINGAFTSLPPVTRPSRYLTRRASVMRRVLAFQTFGRTTGRLTGACMLCW